jgi:cytochrome c553
MSGKERCDMRLRSLPPTLLILGAAFFEVSLTFAGAITETPQQNSLLAQAQSTTPDLVRGAEMYRGTCARCHHAHGNGAGDREFAQLSGQREDYLLAQLTGFVTGDREAPRMHKVLSSPGMADPQTLHDIAAYLASEPHDPHVEHGDAHFLGTGRRIYADRCASCHGPLGEGQGIGPIPSISAQNYTYLLSQLKGFKAGHRANADANVIRAIDGLSSDEMSAVADYISRLPESAQPGYGTVGR